MTRYDDEDERRQRDRRRRWPYRPHNDKLDFPPARQNPPAWVTFLVNAIVSFVVNILSTLFYPTVIGTTIAIWAVVEIWTGMSP